MLNRELTAATAAAREAGRLLKRHFGKLHASQVHTKGTQSIVTDLDRRAERMIVGRLRRAFPSHGVLAEEGTLYPASSGYRWIIDPLDGTTNYVTNIPYYCVSIALTVNGSPVMGVIVSPDTNEQFTGVAGHGARRNGHPLRVSQTRTLRKSMVAISYGAAHAAIDRAVGVIKRLRFASHHLRHNGSAALDLANVAAGRLDAAVMLRQADWDIAAGVVLIREAGGEVTNLTGQPLTWNSAGLVVSNRRLHAALLKKIR